MSTAKCQNPGSGGYNPIFKGEKIFKKVEICFENSYFSKKNTCYRGFKAWGFI